MGRKIANPAKSFKYAVEIGDGTFDALAQSVQQGDSEISSVAHGDGNKNKKTPGKVTVPDITIEMLVSEKKPNNRAWRWFKQAQDSMTGMSELPETIYEPVFIKLLNGRNVPIKRWAYFECWARIIGRNNLGDNEDSNFIETLTLSANMMDEGPLV